MTFTKVIDEVVSMIHTNESSKQDSSKKLLPFKSKNLDADGKEILEKQLAKPIAQKPINCKVAGIDSGFVQKGLAGVDITLIRAAGVIFTYKDSKLTKAEYYPSLYSLPAPHYANGALERDESECSRSLLRLIEEVTTAKNVIEKYKPDYCIMDGSVVPQYADKPRKDSKVETLYSRVLKMFQDLYATAEKNNCQLIGCVEDSRGSRFRSILQENVLPNSSISAKQFDDMLDSTLLDYFLNVGERSMAFSYSGTIEKHPILMDYDEKWANSLYGFYIKPASYDRPLRVEFVSKNPLQVADGIASLVFSLSSMHREYAYPSVLIEADLRARLRPEEINTVTNKIIDKLSKHIKLKMRRESRPF